MPLEIVVDSKMKKGVQNLNLLKKVNELENFLKGLKKMIGFFVVGGHTINVY